jgi:hypothetical protein
VSDRSEKLRLLAVLSLMATAWLSGCGSGEAPHPSGGEDNKLFHEGKGLKLPQETQQALGLQVSPAGPRPVRREMTATARVFERRTNEIGEVRVLASAYVPVSSNQWAKGGSVVLSPAGSAGATTGLVVRVDATPRSAYGQVELVIEAPDPTGLFPTGSSAGARLDAGITEAKVAVPRGALVRAALGDFVYSVEGEFLKRQPVKTGTEDSKWVELLAGPAAGQAVVTRGTEALWLLELSEVGGITHIK